MTTCISALGLALVLAAGEGPGTVAKSGSGRIAAVEKELCSAACPPIPPDASSDWLRSADGQRANACRTGCRVEQPASALFQSACDAASSGSVEPSTPVVILAGKEGPELARRLRAALKDGDGKRPTALCARARATLASSDVDEDHEAPSNAAGGAGLRRARRPVHDAAHRSPVATGPERARWGAREARRSSHEGARRAASAPLGRAEPRRSPRDPSITMPLDLPGGDRSAPRPSAAVKPKKG